MSEAATVLLILVGLGIIVVGVLLLLQRSQPHPSEKVVVREVRPHWRRPYWGTGPYYAHLPYRPVLY